MKEHYTSIRQLKLKKKKKVTLPNTGEIAKKTDYSVIVDGDKNGIDTVEKKYDSFL